MEAVVLEIREKKAAVMTKDGRVIRVKDKGYEVGQNISLSSSISQMRSYRRLVPYAAAAAILFMSIGSGTYAYCMPYGTVSLDVNPSVEYTINRFDRVLSASGVNDDGSVILDGLDKKEILHKNIDVAIDNTLKQIKAEGYLTDEDNYVVVSANMKKDERADRLLTELDNVVENHDGLTAVPIKASMEDIEKAHGMGMTAGKMKVVNMLDDISDTNIDDTWRDRSITDIMHEYDRLHTGTPGEPGNAEKDSGQDRQPVDNGAYTKNIFPEKEDASAVSPDGSEPYDSDATHTPDDRNDSEDSGIRVIPENTDRPDMSGDLEQGGGPGKLPATDNERSEPPPQQTDDSRPDIPPSSENTANPDAPMHVR